MYRVLSGDDVATCHCGSVIVIFFFFLILNVADVSLFCDSNALVTTFRDNIGIK